MFLPPRTSTGEHCSPLHSGEILYLDARCQQLDKLLGNARAAPAGTDGECRALDEQLVAGHLDAVLLRQLEQDALIAVLVRLLEGHRQTEPRSQTHQLLPGIRRMQVIPAAVSHRLLDEMAAVAGRIDRHIMAAPADTALWDVIVSNPPYICMSERAEMSPHVLDHEPATALFVPDSDPLLFYRAIARYATRALKPGGTLLFEINALYASETSAMLHALGFAASVERDQYDRPRFIIAQL